MSVANPVIGLVDPSIKRIFLDAGITEYHPVTDIYAEIRNLRRTDENHRWYKMPVTAYGNVPKGGGKFTPRYVTFNYGWRVVPDDVDHALYISGEQITDDGQSGPACMDTSLLSSGTNVTIHYEPPAAEVIQVSTGSGLSQEEHDKLIGLPDDTLTTEEHDQLMSISPSGLTQAEHDQLMAASLEDGGRLQSIDSRLPGTPASQGDVTAARDEIIIALPDVSNLALEASVQDRPTLSQIEASTALAKQAELLRALGLAQDNFRIKNIVRDADNNITSSTVRSYASAADAQNDQNPTAEYQVTATFSGPNELTSYLSKRVA